MFFFWELYNDSIIQYAFKQVCTDKMLVDGYIDLSDYVCGKISKKEYLTTLESIGSRYVFLYKNPFPSTEIAYDFWLDNAIEPISFDVSIEENDYVNPSAIECEAIVYWVYKVYTKQEERIRLTIELFRSLKEFHGIENQIKHANGVFYNAQKIDLRIISSLEDFNREIHELNKGDDTIFYRGHSNINYVLQPSVMRSKSWIENEHKMYNEVIIECPESFLKCNTHLEKLVKMQHYGLPTRLLDITRNPLVALYFACNASSNKNGEVVLISSKNCPIKYPQSDCVSIIACLSVIKQNEKEQFRDWAQSNISKKEFNKKADRLIKEIRLEKPGFSATINKEDLLESYIVMAIKNNRRIINQDGAFILCGLLDEKDLLNQYRLLVKDKKVVLAVDGKQKKEIMNDLKRCSIHYATLFPEIECVTEYIRDKYYS